MIKKPSNQYQVILEVADSDRSAPEDLGLLYIKSDDGTRMVPLKALTTWHQVIGPQAVNHVNQFTSVTLFFNLKPGYTIGQATDYVENAAKQILPPDIRGDLQGDALTFRDTVSSLTVLMGLAVFVMYVILAILYESYIHPLTVLSSLPVALLGGLLTLWLFHSEASLYAYIGMFMLMGIVKKNGIMIVDFAQQRVEQGMRDDQAIHDASMERFRPIIMTTLAALMGALPIALGFGADGSSRRPLGLVVVGGLIVSQFITLYITPAIYLYLEEFRRTCWIASLSSAQATRICLPPEMPLRSAPEYPTNAMTKRVSDTHSVWRRSLLTCAAFFCVAGCSVGPNYKRPSVDVPSTYRDLSSDQTTSANFASLGDQKWWEVFQDKALQDLVRAAIAKNYDVRIAAARVLEAQAQLGITRADQFPSLSGGGSVTAEHSPAIGPIPSYQTNLGQLTLSGAWNLDFWGRYRRATEAARAGLLASEWARQEVTATLVANVASSYFQLRELDLELEISKQTLDSRQQSLDLTRTLTEHGIDTLLDQRQAEELVYTAGAQIPILKGKSRCRRMPSAFCSATIPEPSRAASN